MCLQIQVRNIDHIARVRNTIAAAVVTKVATSTKANTVTGIKMGIVPRALTNHHTEIKIDTLRAVNIIPPVARLTNLPIRTSTETR